MGDSLKKETPKPEVQTAAVPAAAPGAVPAAAPGAQKPPTAPPPVVVPPSSRGLASPEAGGLTSPEVLSPSAAVVEEFSPLGVGATRGLATIISGVEDPGTLSPLEVISPPSTPSADPSPSGPKNIAKGYPPSSCQKNLLLAYL